MPTPLVTPKAVRLTVETDASDYGWGGLLMSDKNVKLGSVHHLFTPSQRERHITWKETVATWNTFRVSATFLYMGVC